MGSGQGGEGALAADPHRHGCGVRRLPRGHPTARVLGSRPRYRGTDRTRARIRSRPARDQPRCLRHRARDVRGGSAGHVRHDPSDGSGAGGESGHRVRGVTRRNGRREGHAGASRDRAWHRRAAQVERQSRCGRPVARPDRRVGRRRRHDPGRRSEQGPDLEHVRARSRGRRCRGVGDPGRPGAARSRPVRRHRRQRFAADQGPHRVRPAADLGPRGRARSRSTPAATRRSTRGTRRSSSRSWPASGSRPGSSDATPARW